MSQDYHHHHDHHQQQGIFNFSNGLERSNTPLENNNSPNHQQQIQRDKVRLHGFDSQQQPQPPPQPSLIGGIEEEQEALPVYETTGMLSEMFNFPHGASSAAELLEQQQQQQQQQLASTRTPPPHEIANSNDWYGNRQSILTDSKNHHHNNNRDSSSGSNIFHHHQMSNMNAESAAAMQLFLMNPQTTRSPSPPPQPHPSSTNSSTLHMLLPNPSTTNLQGFNSGGAGGSFGQFTWGQEGGGGATTSHHHQLNNNQPEIASVVEGQGLSLSLSSSLQQHHHSDELRMGDPASFLYYNQGGGAGTSYKNLGGVHHHLQGGGLGQINHIHHGHVGFGSSSSPSSLGVVNVLRNSKYVKAAQELLEEFCSVGRGQFKKNKFSRQLSNPNSNQGGGGGGGSVGGASSSSSKDVSPLSPADRIEHQRRKVKLLTMLDEACNLSLSLLSFSLLPSLIHQESRSKKYLY
ncbi:hypothetical protein TSUD_191660 [Trifolium subterraneum]|uniref:POX domain-containing protein n=1 Tax=Trifolium subterraneum TaxID=3900 RepID=A0A2Z6M2Q8_TRISU|nr:hypothetical protein TSUD_191660 [Trifolium subterraneum]